MIDHCRRRGRGCSQKIDSQSYIYEEELLVVEPMYPSFKEVMAESLPQ